MTKPIETKPWFAPPPLVVRQRPKHGMLREREGSALFHICRDVYQAKGRIVEAGSYLGASTWCMANGLMQRDLVLFDTVQPIVCYDLFRAYGRYANGGHFLKQFVDNLGSILPWIEIRQGDFMKARWGGDPIELLFIDVSKTAPLNSHLITEFFPHLMGEGAIVIHQDFHHPFLPHIHVQMEQLMDFFEILDEKVDDSCIFRMRSAIPRHRIQDAVRPRSGESELSLLDDHIARFTTNNRRYLYLVKVILLRRVRGMEAARSYYHTVVEGLGDFPSDQQWAHYLDRVRTAHLHLDAMPDSGASDPSRDRLVAERMNPMSGRKQSR